MSQPIASRKGLVLDNAVCGVAGLGENEQALRSAPTDVTRIPELVSLCRNILRSKEVATVYYQ
ncbi:hypothetical protein [Mycobacterium haemophilum]|uniref:Uncharacterized protein n=1 Tax=Mycobacterium haemophilum TaxID=29311 RepID=A0A0I9VHH5_9MYCO|nr:hypothetical protein [Mycobacterium haemophilum]KLO32548.1 hypothetical protein ABH39_05500 [Mycobacterium haemophilum]KLO36808.1 hypothetical protein ABH38_10345 [Mycobacterium haemophilum]KLO42828.1 hypothetical protein ABH37_08970 [Mycobacterium haemophilum]KLO55798.1 hypothetical protein ABH36_05475 [Mycobacterium haemophilum]